MSGMPGSQEHSSLYGRMGYFSRDTVHPRERSYEEYQIPNHNKLAKLR